MIKTFLLCGACGFVGLDVARLAVRKTLSGIATAFGEEFVIDSEGVRLEDL